jgi:hypothetical protein
VKAIIAPCSCLVALTVLFICAPPAHSADSNIEASVLAFKSCDDAVTKNLEHTTLPIREGYAVNLFVTRYALPPKTTDVGVWIEDGPGLKPENPRITAVCVNKTPNLPTAPKGQIEFHSSTGDKITIRFHLDSLKMSKWKKKMVGGVALANDSILLKEFTGGTPPMPGLNDWPSCLGQKTVPVGDDPISHSKDTEISFDFSRCANPGGPDRYYVYQLVLAQYPPGGGPPTDYPIDPLIINRP